MKLLRPIFPLVLMVLLLATTAMIIAPLQGHMNAMRSSHGLTESAPLENAPPAIAFTTVALGGFRGLVADALWIRAIDLQEKGQYFEMFQLASWIVKLQPRFTQAVIYQAWNMTYNISVTFSSSKDRWRWVQRGIELLRDEAIPYNPKEPLLYRELSWFYLHKISQESDDAHRYYKFQLARQMIAVLGAPTVEWEALVVAPATPDALSAALGTNAKLWGMLAQLNMKLEDVEHAFRRNAGRLPEALLAPGALPESECATLELYLRRHWLTEVYKIDPAYALALNKKYGKLDWRMSQAYAIYWASRGIDIAPGNKNIHCDRNIFQALKSAFQSGKLIYVTDTETLEYAPNLALLPAIDRTYREDIAKYEGGDAIKVAHQNFLSEAIITLYTFGRRDEAAKRLADARKLYGGKFRGKSIDDFALAGLAEDMTEASYEQALSTIQGYLHNAYYWLACNEGDRAAAFESIGTKLWQRYEANYQPTAKKRRALPPLDSMKKNAAKDLIANLPGPLAENLQSILNAAAETKPAPKN